MPSLLRIGACPHRSIDTCAAAPLCPGSPAPPQQLQVFDTPSDGGGSLTATWAAIPFRECHGQISGVDARRRSASSPHGMEGGRRISRQQSLRPRNEGRLVDEARDAGRSRLPHQARQGHRIKAGPVICRDRSGCDRSGAVYRPAGPSIDGTAHELNQVDDIKNTKEQVYQTVHNLNV